jgi:2-polyprenyl-3-methyl-5-hydroxy-6-metoxy-1,4-benzoquinol methylase
MIGPALAPFGTELLDDPAADPVMVSASLRNIARSNRWFGGCSALRFGLRLLLADVAPGSRLTLLDVGTGMGDLPRDAVRWGAINSLLIVPIGLERHRTAARLASQSGVPTTLGCAGSLPVRKKSVDLVLVSQVAHHLAPDAVVDLLRACDQVARRGVILSDLRRSWFAAAGFWVGSRALRFDAATRSDGVTSVRRGFSAAELRELLRRAGILAKVHLRPGFRLVVAWQPGALS